MIIWTTLFALLLSIAIFGLNFLIILTVAVNSKLHTITNILSCNLWLANCIISGLSVFHNLFYNINSLNPILFKTTNEMQSSYYFTKNNVNNSISSPPIIFSTNFQQKKKAIIDSLPLFKLTLISPSTTFIKNKKKQLHINKNILIDNDNLEVNVLTKINHNSKKSYINIALNYMLIFGPQTLAALFNTTISLMTLLAMAFVQTFSRHQSQFAK